MSPNASCYHSCHSSANLAGWDRAVPLLGVHVSLVALAGCLGALALALLRWPQRLPRTSPLQHTRHGSGQQEPCLNNFLRSTQ